MDKIEHLGQRRHRLAAGVERADLGQRHPRDRAVAARGAVDGRIVHDDDAAVGGGAQVGLDHLHAMADRGAERAQAVFRHARFQPAMRADHEPGGGGLGGEKGKKQECT